MARILRTLRAVAQRLTRAPRELPPTMSIRLDNLIAALADRFPLARVAGLESRVSDGSIAAARVSAHRHHPHHEEEHHHSVTK